MDISDMKLRIIVIDDEVSIRNPMQWHLEDQGHEVLTAAEPQLCSVYQGCECKENHPCGDILFVDFNMPRMNGLELVELMAQKGCKGHPNNKIIMSGDTSAIDAAKAREFGCIIEQKPLSLQRIDEIIEQCKTRVSPERKLADLSEKIPDN